MQYSGISLQRISLGALIISLGLLVDDAMITIEMMVSQLEAGVDRELQRDSLDALKQLNQMRLDVTGDPEVATRINSFEMAFRMQAVAPDLMDISKESKETLELYGAEPGKASFANNCLLARRLVERGVRFVQLIHTDWDHHGGSGDNLTTVRHALYLQNLAGGLDLSRICPSSLGES